MSDYSEHVAGIREMEEERDRTFLSSNFPIRTSNRRSGPANPRQADQRSARNREQWGSTSIGALGGFLNDLGGRMDRDADRALLRRVSMLGVDPRSPEGQQILDLFLIDVPANTPEVKALVEEYQARLIGPQSKSTTAPGVVQGPFVNQYGYTAGEEFSILDGLPTEQLARIQDRMAALGLLGSKDFQSGQIGKPTVGAMSELLWMANAEGTDWTVQLAELERIQAEQGGEALFGAGGSGRERAPFTAPTYLAPDYATLAQLVKSQMREALGRDPDESEMAMLTAELAGWDRDAFDAEVAAARSEYDAGEEGRDASAQMQGVDPVARFKESFESRFAGELRGIERTEEATETQEIVQAGVSRLSQMSGGMG